MRSKPAFDHERSSHSIGCAAARGAEDDFLVCRYSEGGNVIGERPF